jgi:hypothetical protein
MKIKIDSRSKDFLFHKHFGFVTSFQDEYLVDRLDVVDPIQTSGNVQCTALTTTSIASDKEGIYYDVNDLWARVPKDSNGADPKTVFKEAITNGLLPKGGNLRFKPFNSYFSALGGGVDSFDSMRSALILSKYPVAIWGGLFDNWIGGTLAKGNRLMSYHCFACEGWVTFNGVPYLQFDLWTGRKYYMSREVFNWYCGLWATDTAVLSTAEINARRDKTIMESIIDLCKNTIILLQELLAKKKEIMNFNTPQLSRHSARVIMDTFGLTWDEKDLLCAVIQAESGFNNNAVCYNRDKKGNVMSEDRGICQINSFWHCGKGKTFPSVEYVVDHPEEAIKFMIRMYEAGQLKLWCAYTNGSYKKYLPVKK